MKKIKLFGLMVLAAIFTITVNVSAQEHEEHGEESGKMYKKNQTYTKVRGGVKLVLKYDNEADAFLGVMENVSKKTAAREAI